MLPLKYKNNTMQEVKNVAVNSPKKTQTHIPSTSKKNGDNEKEISQNHDVSIK